MRIMINKKLFFVFLLMVLVIGTISAVSANECANDLTMEISDDNIAIDSSSALEGDDLAIDSSSSDLSNENNINSMNDSVINSNSINYDSINSDSINSDSINPNPNIDDEINNHKDSSLKAVQASKSGTFTELQTKINKASKGSTIYLDKNYLYNDDFKGKYGIVINKSITIDGKGHVIDGLKKSNLIFINDASNVVFKNIIFRKGDGDENGAINLIGSDHIEFNNCSFNYNYGDRGAVFLSGSDYSSFINCRFNENIGENGGALILADSDYSRLVNCIFFGNEASDGGAVFITYSDYSYFFNCTSEGNSVDYTGGAFYLDYSDNSSFIDCVFDTSSAKDGGAFYLGDCHNSSFINCSYWNNQVDYYGAVCYLDNCYDSSFISCNFTGNSGSNPELDETPSIGGGVFYISESHGLYFTHCNFSENETKNDGGAIYASDSDVHIDSSVFEENCALCGGALYAMSSDIFIDSSLFESSVGDRGGSIFANKSNIYSKNSSFIQYYEIEDEYVYIPASGAYHLMEGNIGGAIYSLQSVLNISSNKFNNNFGLTSGGDIYSQYSMIYIDDCSFSNSFSNGFGGSLSFNNDYVQITDCSFENCSSRDNGGGGIYSINSILNCSDSDFTNCYSYFGGSICSLNTDLSINNNNFYKSSAEYYGGSIYFLYGTLDINGSLFSNSYGQYGGSIYIRSPQTIKNITNNQFLFSQGIRGPRIYIDQYYGEISNSGNVYTDEYEEKGLFSDYGMGISFESNEGLVPLIHYYPSNESLPSFYDPRGGGDSEDDYEDEDDDSDIAVKDQGIGGNCWAFSGIATLEACLEKVTGEEFDFSEDNAKNLMAVSSIYGLNIDTNNGGYDTMFLAYLASWLGPIYEEYDTYNPLSSLSIDLPSVFHILDIDFLAPRKNSLDNDEYKRAIMNNGAVSVTFDWVENKVSNGFHSVSIIGWDDDYDDIDSLGNYAKGAWIFKNSWGYEWGDGGFGYLSYKQKLSEEIAPYMHAYTFSFKENDIGYTDIYQYDFSGLSDFLILNSTNAYYKNKFIAEDNEFLYAFSTYFDKETDFTYSVSINGNVITKTEDGKDILTSIHHSPAGYHTIPLGYNLTLKEGDEFEIIIKLLNDNQNRIPVCQADELYRTSLPSNASFMSLNGKDWIDLSNLASSNEFSSLGIKANTSQVACVKAFTSNWRMNSDSSIVNSKNHSIITSEGTELSQYEICQLRVGSFTRASANETIIIAMSIPEWRNYQDEYENYIEVHINDEFYYAKVNEGVAYLDISFDKIGHYDFKAQFKSNIYSSDIVEFDFEVVKDSIFDVDDLNASNPGTFKELQDIIRNAKNGSIISLDKDYAFSSGDESVVDDYIEINKSLIIDGNDHIIDGSSDSGIFRLSSGDNLTMRNIKFMNADKGAIVSNGDLTVSNCYFISNCASGSSSTSTSSSDSSSTACGGAIYCGGTCFIVNSLFESNSADAGGAVYCEGTCFIVNSYFDSNYADLGGAVCCDGSCYIVNSLFDSNFAVYGGAASIVGNESCEIIDSNFIENEAIYGGAIYLESYCYLLDSSFNYNYASNGGAIYSIADLDIHTTGFNYNEAYKDGGAIYLVNSTSYINEGNFTENTAKERGGAICALDFSNLTIRWAYFMDNSASKYGSAIFSVNALNITDSEVTVSSGKVELICFAYDYASNGQAYGDLYFDENYFYINHAPEIYYFREKIAHKLALDLEFNNIELIRGGGVEISRDLDHLSWEDEIKDHMLEICRLVDDDDYMTVLRMKEIEVILINKNNRSDIQKFKIPFNVKLNGYFLNTSSLKYGSYILTGNLSKDLASNCIVKNGTVKVLRKTTLSSLSTFTKVYGTSKNLVVTLKDSSGKAIVGVNISVKLNGKTIKAKTNSKGQISIAISLKPKTYTAYISFAGNDYYASASKKVKVVVKKANPKLTASKKTFKLRNAKKYTVTLKNNLGKALKNAKVTIKVAGKTYTAKTNAKGQVTFNLKLAKIGKFKAVVSFAGNKLYNGLKKAVVLTVKK